LATTDSGPLIKRATTHKDTNAKKGTGVARFMGMPVEE
jgi:hypothetical protein